MKSVLLKTGNLQIIEHTANDNYWADGDDGSGKNMLGIILMRVREELRAISDNADMIFPPWIAFPSTESADMFWRMGMGESYIMKLIDFIKTYGREQYISEFPEPEGWQKFY